jgi:hypothetical protein
MQDRGEMELQWNFSGSNRAQRRIGDWDRPPSSAFDDVPLMMCGRRSAHPVISLSRDVSMTERSAIVGPSAIALSNANKGVMV